MKKIILTAVITVLSTVAMADIPNMDKGSNKDEVTTSQISGAAAEALYSSINSAEKLEASLRTGSTVYKVLRAKDGMDQVICHKTSTTLGRKKISYECTAESSNTDEKLAVYNAPIRMG